MGHRRWTEADIWGGLRGLSTGSMQVLSPGDTPSSLLNVPKRTNVFCRVLERVTLASTSALSTGNLYAELLLERTHPGGPSTAFRRYAWHGVACVESSAGAPQRWFLTFPDKDLTGFPVKHHERERPPYLQDVIRRSTST
jgi:hypothetical protein